MGLLDFDRHTGMHAAPVAATGPRAVAKKEELSVLQQQLDQATFDEDFLQAARVKTLRG